LPQKMPAATASDFNTRRSLSVAWVCGGQLELGSSSRALAWASPFSHSRPPIAVASVYGRDFLSFPGPCAMPEPPEVPATGQGGLFHWSDDSQCCGARSCGWVGGNERSAACPASRCHCLPAADARRLRARVAWRSAHVWASASWRPSLLMTRVSQILESLQCCAPPDASSPQSESRSRRHPSLMLAPVAHASTWYMTCLSH